MRFPMVLLLMLWCIPAAAQDFAKDDAAIREVIAQRSAAGTRLPFAKDAIFWSGAYKKPVLPGEKPVEIDGDRAPAARQPDSQRTSINIRRLEFAKSGDLAWEFSDAQLSYRRKSGEPVSLLTSVLRVWRKEGGEWKVAAQVSRSHDK